MSMPSSISHRPPLAAAVGLLRAAHLPTEDLTEGHCENFFYTGTPDAPSGIIGLEIFGEVALLRSLVVAADRRGHGEGAALLEHAQTFAREQGVRALYLLTTTAESFFQKRGFVRASRETAPAAIRATREFAGICPASSAFMMRPLT